MKLFHDKESGGVPHVTGSARKVAAILEDVLRGRTPTRIARERAVPEPIVTLIRDAHGHPRAAALRQAVADLLPLGEQNVTFPVSTDQRTTMPNTDPTPAPTTPAKAAEPRPPSALPVEQLLKHAASHDLARVRNAAEKITGLIDRIRADLRAYEAAAAERAQKAKDAARIRELRAEIARLTGKKTPTASSRPANTDGRYKCSAGGCDRTFDTRRASACTSAEPTPPQPRPRHDPAGTPHGRRGDRRRDRLR